GANCRWNAKLSCPSSDAVCCQLDVFQRRIVASPCPTASRVPSGENARARVQVGCCSVCNSASVSRSQSLTSPDEQLVANRRLSGAKAIVHTARRCPSSLARTWPSARSQTNNSPRASDVQSPPPVSSHLSPGEKFAQ